MNRIHMAGPWITEFEVETVVDALRNGWYEHAYDYVERFQAEFAERHGRRFGIMTPSCTTATHLLLTALGIGDGDEVIVPECTWIATAAPVTYLRAEPVFCDIDPVHWCLDPSSVERAITPRTRAIIAVDLYGNMPDMGALQDVADRHGIPLIEDAAEALGSRWHGRPAGAFGVASLFSFHRTKTLTTGEGGMLLLDDPALYERCMFLRDHGRRPDGPVYYNFEVTYKYMPFNLQAALGWAQLQRLDELVERKRAIFRAYAERIAGVEGLRLNPEPPHVFNSFWITAVVFGRETGITKAQAIAEMAERGIPARPFFYPLSSLPAYPGAQERYEQRNPVAYDISARGINLSCAMNLTEEQIDAICASVRALVERRRAAA